MDLSELTAYAEKKYHIREEQKWDDFRSFSVLTDPETRKWVALMMRQWDYETGNELCRCDIKCGRQILTEIKEPYVTNAFRMRGEKWAGVIFDDRTEPEVATSPPIHSCRQSDLPVCASYASAVLQPAVKIIVLPLATHATGLDQDGAASLFFSHSVSPFRTLKA